MPKGVGSTIAQNKKAGHDYFIEDTFEAGLVLQGTEIKSIRAGKLICVIHLFELSVMRLLFTICIFLINEQGNRFNHDPLRTRKLLLHKREIARLIGVQKMGGYSLIPLKLYIKDGYAKLLFGIAKGKKNYDKRQDLKAKDANRQIEKALRDRQKY